MVSAPAVLVSISTSHFHQNHFLVLVSASECMCYVITLSLIKFIISIGLTGFLSDSKERPFNWSWRYHLDWMQDHCETPRFVAVFTASRHRSLCLNNLVHGLSYHISARTVLKLDITCFSQESGSQQVKPRFNNTQSMYYYYSYYYIK